MYFPTEREQQALATLDGITDMVDVDKDEIVNAADTLNLLDVYTEEGLQALEHAANELREEWNYTESRT